MTAPVTAPTIKVTNELLGQGTWSTVYKGYDQETPVAVKFLRTDKFHVFQTFVSEAKLAEKISEVAHAVRFRGSFVNNFHYTIVYDLAASSNDPTERCKNMQALQDGKFPSISSTELVSCGKQLLEYLLALKKKGIIHGDIKPANMVWNRQSRQLRVLDLSNAIKFKKFSNWMELTTPYYRSPEMFLNRRETDYGPDLWSAAVVLFQLYTHRDLFPFHEDDRDSTLRYVLQTIGIPSRSYLKSTEYSCEFLAKQTSSAYQRRWKEMIEFAAQTRKDNQSYSSALIDLLSKILRYENRITVEEALQHPFFQSDIHFKLECQGVSENLFLRLQGYEIPLSTRCVHINRSLSEDVLKIGDREDIFYTFPVRISSGDTISISKTDENFQLGVWKAKPSQVCYEGYSVPNEQSFSFSEEKSDSE